MNLFYRRVSLGRICIGILAGVVTIILFSIDRIEPISSIYAGSSAFNYTVIIMMLYLLSVMHFIAGLNREYEISLSYIIFLALYDFATNGLVTILFAAFSFFSLLVGLGFSVVSKKLGIRLL